MYVKNEAGNEKKLTLPVLHTRSVKVQAGETCIIEKKTSKRTRKVPAKTNTPKKLTPKPLNEKISNLPGKKQHAVVDLRKKIVHTCFICHVVEKSTKDLNYKKKHGLTKGAWVCCGFSGCSNRGHVRCVGVAVEKRKDLATLKFNCPKH